MHPNPEQRKLLNAAERRIEEAIREFEELTGLTVAEMPSFGRDNDGHVEYVFLRLRDES